MDAVGTVQIDAAQKAHQQTADQRGLHVRHDSGHHESHDQRQADQRLGRAARGREHVFALGRQVEDDQLRGFGLQPLDVAPESHHQQDVADLERLAAQALPEHDLAAPQTDDSEPVARAKFGFEQVLARERRVGRQHDLRHADVLRPGRRNTLPVSGTAASPSRWRSASMSTSGAKRSTSSTSPVWISVSAVGRMMRRPNRAAALDREDVCTGGVAQPQFLEGAADERRSLRHPHAVLAARELVLLDPVAQSSGCLRRAVGASLPRSQRRANSM